MVVRSTFLSISPWKSTHFAKSHIYSERGHFGASSYVKKTQFRFFFEKLTFLRGGVPLDSMVQRFTQLGYGFGSFAWTLIWWKGEVLEDDLSHPLLLSVHVTYGFLLSSRYVHIWFFLSFTYVHIWFFSFRYVCTYGYFLLQGCSHLLTSVRVL